MPARINIAIDLQRAILDIKRKMGKNAMLRGMNLLEGLQQKNGTSRREGTENEAIC